MSQIKISHLTFGYDDSSDQVFSDVSFQIDTGWKLGFCGRNGRGKTTFLKLLMGQYEYRGSITANVSFEYFPFAVRTPAQNTLEVLTQISPEAALWQFERELGKLAVGEEALYRPFATLSNGEQTKALLAGLFLRENAFLLIDEPTNHLDLTARQTVARYLKGKSGFILVSHDRAFLDDCVDHILSINRADIQVMPGNFSVWWEEKQRRDAFELAQNAQLEGEIARLEQASARTAGWSDKVEKSKHTPLSSGLRADQGYIGHKAAKMMKRSKATQARRESAAAEKSKLLKNVEQADALKIHPLPYHASRLLSLESLAVSYGGRAVFRGLNLVLEQGERLAIQGGNGCGKSSVLKLLCGQEVPHTGLVHVGSRLVISYLPQDASFLCGDLSDFAHARQIDQTLLKTILRKLDFPRAAFEKDMGDYSAGQKKKVLIAASLCQKAHLYIWDEPLNYVDLLSRLQIEELIAAHLPTMIFVEHDRAFCQRVATRTLDLSAASSAGNGQ